MGWPVSGGAAIMVGGEGGRESNRVVAAPLPPDGAAGADSVPENSRVG